MKNNSNAWLYLTFAICTEVAGISSMKLAAGFTQIGPSILIFLFYALSLCFITLSLKSFEISFVYAMWSSLGTLLIFLVGVCFFHEPLTLLKALSVGCIVSGVIGLKRA